MSSTRYGVVNIALSYVGATRGSKGHQKLVSLYNSKHPHGTTALISYPWCAIAWSAWQIQAGNTSKEVPLSMSCSQVIRDAKNLGIWKEADNYKDVAKGDAILYDWNDSTGSRGDCTGDPEHIGMVYAVDDKYLYIVEGNKGSGVCGTRKIQRNGQFIRGFVHPNYAKTETKKISYRPTTTYKGKIPTKNDAFYHCTNEEAVKRTKAFLNWCLNAKMDVKNSDCGKTCEQWILNFQRTYGLKEDGCFGPACRAKAKKIIAKYKNMKAAKIIDACNEFCWPYGTDKRKWEYDTGRPVKAYKEYCPSKARITESDCGYFVRMALKRAGVGDYNPLDWDKSLPKGMKIVRKGKKIPKSKLKAGDVIRYKKTGGEQHTLIVYGKNKIAEAGRGYRFPVIRKNTQKYHKSNVKISTLQLLRVK